MTIITKERDNPSHTSDQNDPWKITGKLKQSLEETKKNIAESRRLFESQVLACPTDGKPSRFIRYEGSYTRVMGIFRCENGHQFPNG